MARVVCITLNPALDLAFNLDALTLGHVNRPTGAQLRRTVNPSSCNYSIYDFM